jgi:hypothetical protein
MMGSMEPADRNAAVAPTIRERTGRTLDEWVDLVRFAGLDPLKQNEVRRWLRDAHGVPQSTQWAIAEAAARRAGWVEPTVEDYADKMYAGSKAPLRPLHDGVVALAVGLGEDCAVEGRSTYAPVVRRTQFAAVAPGPHGTLRVGFRFRTTVPDDDRLSAASGFAQSTHWLHLDADSDENDVRSLEPLLEAAYEQNS